MQHVLARYRGIVIVGVLLALPFVLLYAQSKKPAMRGPVVGVVVDASALVERGLLFAVGGIVDTLSHYVTSVGLFDEVAVLRRKSRQTDWLKLKVAELERENESLRALARAAATLDAPHPVGARVLARKGDPLTRLLTLDIGANHGVRRGDGVVDAAGVVGIVAAVGQFSCDVLALTDPSASIDVITQRTRARGVLRGEDSDERYAAVVEDFDKLRAVAVGDALVTTGIATRFPPGILVGHVVEVDAPEDSLYVQTRVKPAANLGTVEHVLVLVGRQTPRSIRLGREVEEDAPLEAELPLATTSSAAPTEARVETSAAQTANTPAATSTPASETPADSSTAAPPDAGTDVPVAPPPASPSPPAAPPSPTADPVVVPAPTSSPR